MLDKSAKQNKTCKTVEIKALSVLWQQTTELYDEQRQKYEGKNVENVINFSRPWISVMFFKHRNADPKFITICQSWTSSVCAKVIWPPFDHSVCIVRMTGFMDWLCVHWTGRKIVWAFQIQRKKHCTHPVEFSCKKICSYIYMLVSEFVNERLLKGIFLVSWFAICFFFFF